MVRIIITVQLQLHTKQIITHADGSRRDRVFTSVCMCVCLLFSHDVSKIDAARIIELNTEMFHDEYWKPIYFEVKRSKVKVTSHKNIAGMGL